jgi:hypothetical protein
MSATEPDSLEEAPLDGGRAAPAWPLLAGLPALLGAQPGSRQTYRELLRQADEELKARFLAEEPVENLVHARAALVDTVLRQVWQERMGSDDSRALVAVGGYGRGELHPCSDIDLLILVGSAPDGEPRGELEGLIAFLWDIGLEVGHSVRTVAECAEESAADVSVMTTNASSARGRSMIWCDGASSLPGSCAASSRRKPSFGKSASVCTCSPAGARTVCCSTIRFASRRVSATRTPPIRSRSSSSCSGTTAPSWT